MLVKIFQNMKKRRDCNTATKFARRGEQQIEPRYSNPKLRQHQSGLLTGVNFFGDYDTTAVRNSDNGTEKILLQGHLINQSG